MKVIWYNALLLGCLGLLVAFLIERQDAAMSMEQMVSISVVLGLYVVAMSLVGEGRANDERDRWHRYLANRSALIAGTAVLSVGVIYQLFTHTLDYWLLAGLAIINMTKIGSYIFSFYKK